MATLIFSGQNKNVASFEALIAFCTIRADKYLPSNQLIKTDSMKQKKDRVDLTLAKTKNAKTIYSNATNMREILFEDLPKLSTRVINALNACGAKPQTIDDAKTSHRKIQGRKKSSKEKPTDEEQKLSKPTIATIPESDGPDTATTTRIQKTYDNMLDNFDSLVQTVASESLYAPNEVDLKLTALKDLLVQLKVANSAVIEAIAALNKARGERDVELYHPKTGLVYTAGEAKQYIRSIYGANSREAKEVGTLKFYSPRK